MPAIKIFVATMLVLVIAALGAMRLWRWLDHRADAVERARLVALQPAVPTRFDLAMLEGLPLAAQRYFEFSIEPGTPLYTVADISMTGTFSLGSRDAPKSMDMQAEQTLAAPEGFVWTMHAWSPGMRVSGSDSGRWTRFWLFGIVPVARLGGDPDHRLSAFGRYVAEAVFWTPAALLPGPGVEWQSVDEHIARVTVTHDGLQQEVELEVDDSGRPEVVRFLRWSNANADKVFRRQAFGGYLSAHRRFMGFTVPTHVEAGNHFETDDYFPFFVADITDVSFPRIASD